MILMLVKIFLLAFVFRKRIDGSREMGRSSGIFCSPLRWYSHLLGI